MDVAGVVSVVGAGILGAGVSVEGNSEERQEDWSPLILERMWLFRCFFFLFFLLALAQGRQSFVRPPKLLSVQREGYFCVFTVRSH